MGRFAHAHAKNVDNLQGVKCVNCDGRLVRSQSIGRSTITHVDPHLDRQCKAQRIAEGS